MEVMESRNVMLTEWDIGITHAASVNIGDCDLTTCHQNIHSYTNIIPSPVTSQSDIKVMRKCIPWEGSHSGMIKSSII